MNVIKSIPIIKEILERIDKLEGLKDNYDDLEKKYEILEKKYNALTSELEEKNKLINKLGQNINTNDDVDDLINLLSKDKINEYVEELLKNPKTNIEYLPDYLEGPIRKLAYKSVLDITNLMLSTAHIEMLGHRLNFKFTPIVDKKNIDEYTYKDGV